MIRFIVFVVRQLRDFTTGKLIARTYVIKVWIADRKMETRVDAVEEIQRLRMSQETRIVLGCHTSFVYQSCEHPRVPPLPKIDEEKAP